MVSLWFATHFDDWLRSNFKTPRSHKISVEFPYSLLLHIHFLTGTGISLNILAKLLCFCQGEKGTINGIQYAL